MHLSSFEKMKFFREKYLSSKENLGLKILDLGSTDIFGCYRPIFDKENWQYTGVDLAPGKNVDIVLSDPYNWLELKTGSFDVFISGQTFEHIEYFWVTILEIERVLKPGGLCCILAPSGGPEHRYPLDCWRFYPDGFNALARYANLDVLEVGTDWESRGYEDDSDIWADTFLIAKKPDEKVEKIKDTQIYKREIDENDEKDSLARIIRLLKPEEDVLELGPAEGYLTKFMHDKLKCRVDCVEISSEMAVNAEKYCNKMVVANLDEIDLEETFQEKDYDCVIIADVLEHIKEDAKALDACHTLLKKDGRLILSVPNIAHSSVIGSLLKGQFEYRDQGLLDRSHIKFYTRESILSLLNKCNFHVVSIDTISILPEETQIGDSLTDLPHELQKLIYDRPDAFAYQFIITCEISKDKDLKQIEAPCTSRYIIDLRKSYLERINQRMTDQDVEISELKKQIEEDSALVESLNKKNEALELENTDVKSVSKKFRYEIDDFESKISLLDDNTAAKSNELTATIDQNHILQNELEKHRAILQRIENHPVYKMYRKLKTLFAGSKGGR